VYNLESTTWSEVREFYSDPGLKKKQHRTTQEVSLFGGSMVEAMGREKTGVYACSFYGRRLEKWEMFLSTREKAKHYRFLPFSVSLSSLSLSKKKDGDGRKRGPNLGSEKIQMFNKWSTGMCMHLCVYWMCVLKFSYKHKYTWKSIVFFYFWLVHFTLASNGFDFDWQSLFLAISWGLSFRVKAKKLTFLKFMVFWVECEKNCMCID